MIHGIFAAGSRVALLVIPLVLNIVMLPHVMRKPWGCSEGEGFEFHLPATCMALTRKIAGGGKWSLDRFLAGLAEWSDPGWAAANGGLTAL
jgi:uncharacterized membrane protein YphA (DoxX/SURF4 family)